MPTPNVSDLDPAAQATRALKIQRERIATTLPCCWGDSPLITAVKRGQVFKTLRILERNLETQGQDPVAAITTPDANGRNLLHLAIGYGHPLMLDALENRSGTRATAPSPTESLLVLAMERHVHHRGYHTRQLAMVQALLDRGEAPVEGTAPEPWANFLVNQRQFGALDRFLDHPAARDWRWDVSIEESGRGATSVLAGLLFNGGTDRIARAVAAGAPLLPPPGVWSPLHLAARHGRVEEAVELLAQKPALLAHRTPKGENALHLAVLNLAFESGGWERRTDGFKALLAQATPDVLNAFDDHGRTPVGMAVNSFINRSSANMDRIQEVIGLLLNAGALLLKHAPGEPDVRALLVETAPEVADSPQGRLNAWVMQRALDEEASTLRQAVTDVRPEVQGLDPERRDRPRL